MDYRKLAKICELMASPNDGEALGAARRACAMLNGADQTWSQIIDRASRVTPCPRQSAPRKSSTRFSTHRYGWAAGDLIIQLAEQNTFADGRQQRFIEALFDKALEHADLALTDGQWDRLAEICEIAGVEILREAA